MKERPILFNGDMVRAILDGRKTQTRRVMKPQPAPCSHRGGHSWPSRAHQSMLHVEEEMYKWAGVAGSACPHGSKGDQLWVKETCRAVQDGMTFGINYPADNHTRWLCRSQDTDWLTMYDYRGAGGAIVPSIHMRRWASRIRLEIADVRVERLQEINEQDAATEGFDLPPAEGQSFKFKARHNFKFTWNQIYKNWEQNPWVWVIEFKRIQEAV